MARNLLALPLACLLAVAVGLASADEPEKIVGGQFAYPGEYPYAASFQVNGHHTCGGAIVSETHILTAAHCLVPFLYDASSHLTVVTGTNNVKRGGNTYDVQDIYPHPDYNKVHSWHSDIGIIKLVSPIKFNRSQNKIDLPTAAPVTGTDPVIVGWGYTGMPPRGQASEDLQKIHLNIISQSACQSRHSAEIDSSMICTYNRAGQGTCSGDSGSPLAYGGKVIGIVSGGIPCAVGFPDVFTNVYAFLDFVHHYMQS